MSYSSLRWSTIRIVTLVFAALLSVAVVLFYGVTQQRFLSLERTTGEQSIKLVAQAIEAARQSYVSKNEDWAFWDDTVSFIDSLSPAYIKSNLVPESAATIGVEAILYLDRNGAIRSEHSYDDRLAVDAPMRRKIVGLVGAGGLVNSASMEQRTISGFVSSGNELAIVSAAPILGSNRMGPPKGSVIFVKIVDAKLLQALRTTSQRQFQIWSTEGSNLPQEITATLPKLEGKNSLVEQSESQTMRSFGMMEDLQGTRSIVFAIEEPRPIFEESQQTLLTAIGLLVGSSILFAAALVYLIEYHVLGRILSLGRQLRTIHDKKDLATKVTLEGNDEIQELASIVNFLLNTIEASYSELEQSRDQMYLQSIRFAEQVDRLTKARDHTVARERDTTNLLRTVILQLQDTLSSSADSITHLHADEFLNGQRHHVTIIRKLWERVEAISKETQHTLENSRRDTHLNGKS